MNIFFLNESPYVSAAGYCLKHLSKMPSEVANMLLWPFKLKGYLLPLTKDGSVRRLSHQNHPVSAWIRESVANYEWALNHLWALCGEYQKSYCKVHDASRLWRFCRDAPRIFDFPTDILTPFPRCFSNFKQQLDAEVPDAIQAHRQFYWLDKREFARWPSADAVPKWWPDAPQKYVDKSFKNGKYIHL